MFKDIHNITFKLDYMELLKMKLRCSFGYVNPYTSLGQMQKEKTQVKHRIKSGVWTGSPLFAYTMLYQS